MKASPKTELHLPGATRSPIRKKRIPSLSTKLKIPLRFPNHLMILMKPRLLLLLRMHCPSISETSALTPILTRDEEHRLALAARDGDEEAFNKLVRSNLRYVVSVANRYKGFGLSLEDLINEGNIGLINAIKRFEPERGVKLITYAVWWIRQSIMHALADQKSTVRLPVKQAGLLHKISIMYEQLRQEFEREPTTSELSERLNIKVADIEKLIRANRNYLSLDAAVSPDDDTSYLDLLEEQSAASVEENVVQHFLEEEVEDLLTELDPREREIIRMRYGFDGESMTLEEIGSKLGLSRERIRQIEKKVINRFRSESSHQTLHDFLS